MKTQAVPKPSADVLKGRFFFSIKDDKLNWQGRVIGRVDQDVYLVQFFSWLTTYPTSQQLISLPEMKEWLFYSTAEDMKESYEHGVASKKKSLTDPKKTP